jgi:hypothetical protein
LEQNALSVPVPSPGIGCRGAGARGAGQAGRWRPAAEAGRSHPAGGACPPLRALAVSGGQRRAVPRPFPVPCPALRATEPVRRRALRRAGRSWPSAPVPPGDRPVGAVRGPSPRRVGRGPAVCRRARSPVWAPGAGRSSPDGPWRRGPGPGSRRTVRAGRSARGGPGPAGLRAAVRGGPVVRPEQALPARQEVVQD